MKGGRYLKGEIAMNFAIISADGLRDVHLFSASHTCSMPDKYEGAMSSHHVIFVRSGNTLDWFFDHMRFSNIVSDNTMALCAIHKHNISFSIPH